MKYSFSFLFSFICVLFNVFAQPGSTDNSFNPGDIGYGNGDGISGVSSIAIQPDGKTLITGGALGFFYNGVAFKGVARLNIDGTPDSGFNIGTGATSDVVSVALQTDGKIIIGGWFNSFNGKALPSIARLNTDGSVDLNFNTGTGPNGYVYSVAIQSDGKILIGGSFTSFNGVSRSHIARLNTDGSLDTGFNPGTGASNNINSISIDANGKILIGGSFLSYNSTTRYCVARLNNDGTLDISFNPGTGVNNGITGSPYVNSIKSLNDGTLIIGGSFTSYNGTARNNLARINSNGSLDATFSIGTGPNTTVNVAAQQSDNKIIVGGYFISYNGTAAKGIMRLNTDGTMDTTFISQGINFYSGSTSYMLALAIQSDGKIYAGGWFNAYNKIGRNSIARINTDGSMDMNFNAGSGSNHSVFDLDFQGDGKILAGGSFSIMNGFARNGIARLNADGSLDQSFNPGTGVESTNGWFQISAVAAQPDGRILIGGNMTSYNGISRNNFARLNSDGSIDPTFTIGTGFNSSVNCIALQDDGKILVGGNFTSYNGNAANYLIRLKSDGSWDTTFTAYGGGTNNTVNKILIQPDKNILVVGDFTRCGGITRNRIARIKTNGSIDSGFDPSPGAYYEVKAIALQKDGKMIVGAHYNYYSGTTPYIVRLNTNGSIDNTFNQGGTGLSGPIYSITIQDNGKIIIGGYFSTYDNVAKNCIARLNTNGSIDPTFVSAGPSSYVNPVNIDIRDMLLNINGNLIVGGRFFTAFNNIGRNRLTGLTGGEAVNAGVISSSTLCSGIGVSVPYTASSGIFNSNNIFTAQLSDSSGNFSSSVNIGSINSVSSGIINAIIPNGIVPNSKYRIRVISSNPSVIGSDNGNNLSILSSVISSIALTAAPSTTICPGDLVTFTTAPVNEGNAPQYQWRINSATIASATTDSYSSNSLNDGDTISVTMISSAACVTNSSASNSKIINYKLKTPGAFIQGTSNVSVNSSNIPYSVPNDSSVSFNWSYSGTGVTISGTGNSVLLSFSDTATTGALNVVATNSCGTSGQRSFPITITQITNVLSPASGLVKATLFPNPFDSDFILNLDLVNAHTTATIVLTDALGQELYYFAKDATLDSGQKQFRSPENLREGIYLIKFISDQTSILLKCAKLK